MKKFDKIASNKSSHQYWYFFFLICQWKHMLWELIRSASLIYMSTHIINFLNGIRKMPWNIPKYIPIYMSTNIINFHNRIRKKKPLKYSYTFVSLNYYSTLQGTKKSRVRISHGNESSVFESLMFYCTLMAERSLVSLNMTCTPYPRPPPDALTL